MVKVIQLNSEIESLFIGYLENMDGIYGKIDPFTDDGYVIKIPLSHSVKINKKCFNSIVSEFFIIIPEKQPPFLLAFEDKNKAISIPFWEDIELLSKKLDFNLKGHAEACTF